ncbi:MAG TPA: [Fe-Fe] hydrogenase large subunit C-terminal domain-containing protein [Bryobacteraceae bacterium]|nr:[Fe-Fe] hydrogenase large subunit C-terminal domain-containing protein [Bryobacteraceae bacterium]
MNALCPVYTERTECQDCYKCIRECPVKAIKVESGYASVVAELCISCGRCVASCPNGAKKVRYDRGRVERLLASGAEVVVSLAPSWASDFPELRPGQMIAALRLLGFHAASETALGAQEVSAHLAQLLSEQSGRTVFSAACPVVVEFVRKYRPELTPNLSGLLSPALAHARLLRTSLGDHISVVFIGPCIAKKKEADQHPGLLSAALTFAELRNWLRDREIIPAQLTEMPGDRFVPETAREGGLYPIEGGMITGIKAQCQAVDAAFMSFSGLSNVLSAIDGIAELRTDHPVFLELLACGGGCVNGPKVARTGGTAAKRLKVIRSTPSAERPQPPSEPIESDYPPDPPPNGVAISEQQIRDVLRSVGKFTVEDELNCNGCGYDSCREFAKAFTMGRAERNMCVGYMRQLAQKKTHVLMQKMPSAIVIADENLRIVEYNPSFSRFFAGDDPDSSLEGTELSALVPFFNLFRMVLNSGDELPDREIRFRGRVFNCSIFTIEKDALVCGIFRDATKPTLEKEQIIQRARQVIQKNLLTVQQIAYLIGENAAESEITLNSIVESFLPKGGSGDEG